MVSDNFAHSLSSDVGIIDLNDDQIALVNGGLSTIARAFIGSFLGKAVYDAVKHVAENGGPPPPNLGFH
ncbi:MULTISPECIES: hypothetical protein [Sphingomonas]|uniref:hypothetical protein n=1 Tax=Sphingomonas TaxID=13687 RepID=UPI00257F20C0|nr:hypothetical protein [Sphingomonas sp. 67-41]